VRNVPTGTEKGKFLAVDLGGSNCRICLVELHGNSTFTAVQTKHPVPASIMVNESYKPLFSFIAQNISTFLKAHCELEQKEHYSLGFTFSFTCDQTSLAGGILIHWDKGWDIPEAVGKDPCAMLQEAIDSAGLPISVAVLANDSVGALLTRAYTSSQDVSTLGAIIFGTGTNAAYVEKLSNIRRLGVNASNGHIMVINTEWGCFDDEMRALPRTSYDDDLDISSAYPGSQLFEKQVSGLYLGELLRLVILQLIKRGALTMKFADGSPVLKRGGIESSFLSHIVKDTHNDLESAMDLIKISLFANDVSPDDARSIQYLAAAIARRAARLAGASLAAIIIQSGRLEPSNIEPPQQEVVPKPTSNVFQQFIVDVGIFLRKILHSMKMSFLAVPRLSRTTQVAIADPVKVKKEDVIDIGADGSVIESYPGFEGLMRGAMREVPEIGPAGEQRVRIGLVKDGSGIGAALMAQAAT
jgi:hexokinase